MHRGLHLFPRVANSDRVPQNTYPNSRMHDQERRWVAYDQTDGVLLRLVDECSGNPIDDALRRPSLLVYSATNLWFFQGLACMKSVSLGLQKTINEGYAVLLPEAPDLLLWTLFIGS